MSDWNAEQYHQLSAPQQSWGRRVLERLPLTGDELVLDVGCGTGQLTEEVQRRLPRGRVIGADRSDAMVESAAMWLSEHAPRAKVIQADGAALPFRRVFDGVFSGATFHWILDHGALFRSIITALKPGGRLAAQCGGAGNLSLLRGRAQRLQDAPSFAFYFDGWTEPWYYADAEATTRRLVAAGFVDVKVWLEDAPTTFESADAFRDFVATVCLRPHLDQLPTTEGKLFLAELTSAAAGDSPAFTLDYRRLNIDARRPA
jgi:trans-aconitate 2-methyltransferase